VFMFIRVCVLTDPTAAGPFGPEASTQAVTGPSRSGCFRLEHQLPGGISSSHWISAPFPRRTRKRDKSHACALRCLGQRWLKILWKMWQTGTRYDAELHQKNQLKHGSWVLKLQTA